MRQISKLYYVKCFFIFIWLVIVCILGTLYSILRWGNLNTNHHFSRLFSWGALWILGLKVEVLGLEHLENHQPCVYIMNHQSMLDVITFGSVYPQHTLIIGKKELAWIPFFGLYFIASGNILINRQKKIKAIMNLSLAVDAVKKRAASIWIFPEGTRNKSVDPMLPFKKGAFLLAIQAGVPIVPMVCAPLGAVWDRKTKQMKRGILKIRVLPPVPTYPDQEKKLDSFIHETRELMLKALRGLET